ncbi:hypothetical protein OPT61_g1533 [Boeremia exigua]|uniref:Uncharacterized protein n=1 Tax=Boeremia exigua TaxID=749465 RepID=A0ACC2IQ45_9PLEO|nr:hypothetical protein OPT61_g1533 [Boeremia exigua]
MPATTHPTTAGSEQPPSINDELPTTQHQSTSESDPTNLCHRIDPPKSSSFPSVRSTVTMVLFLLDLLAFLYCYLQDSPGKGVAKALEVLGTWSWRGCEIRRTREIQGGNPEEMVIVEGSVCLSTPCPSEQMIPSPAPRKIPRIHMRIIVPPIAAYLSTRLTRLLITPYPVPFAQYLRIALGTSSVTASQAQKMVEKAVASNSIKKRKVGRAFGPETREENMQ